MCLVTPNLVYAQDEIVLFEPFTTSNMNPFTQIHGIPTTRSANLVGEKKFELQLQTAKSALVAIEAEHHMHLAMIPAVKQPKKTWPRRIGATGNGEAGRISSPCA